MQSVYSTAPTDWARCTFEQGFLKEELSTYSALDIVMLPTLRTIMNSSYYYEYQENIHLRVVLFPA